MTSSAIGILGSVFDPVHNGHLAVAALAREACGLDTVLFVPAGNPPHKKSVTPVRHRLAMVRSAISGWSWAHIRESECRRPGYSYTVETLRELKTESPETTLYFIIGTDNLMQLPTWRCYREICSLVTFCVVHRPGHGFRLPQECAGLRYRKIPSPEWNISSTMIRDYLNRGHSCACLAPDTVLEYISRHDLYNDSHQNRERGYGCGGR